MYFDMINGFPERIKTTDFFNLIFHFDLFSIQHPLKGKF